MSPPLVVTYHAVEDGPAPLCLPPAAFADQLDWLTATGYRTVTASRLGAMAAGGPIPAGVVALTFDDAFASVVEHALPLLAERGMTATVFCVAAHVGARNDWPTQPAGAYRSALASAAALREAVAGGLEIGSHGMHHAPMHRAGDALAQVELRESRDRLQELLGTPVRSYAFPYAVGPSPAARPVLEAVYDVAFHGGPALLPARPAHLDVPRVDAHYLRPLPAWGRLGGTLLRPYVAGRRAGSRARRLARPDHD